MFRWIEVKARDDDPLADPFTTLDTSAPPRVAGYLAIRPDRLRTEFSVLGQLVSMVDGSGNELRYEHADPTRAGRALTRVFEPACLSDCRETRVAYTPQSRSGSSST